MIDKNKIKNELTIDQIANLIDYLGGEPKIYNDYLISRTICHNEAHNGSHKLYYYDNTKLFRCYTDCASTFDIFELIKKVQEIPLYQSIIFVANYFNIPIDVNEVITENNLVKDWNIFNHYEKCNEKKDKQIIHLQHYDESILKYLLQVKIPEWEKEGITPEVMRKNNILFSPKNNSIIIPHYDKDNNLIGIRERTLSQEQAEYAKYKPAILNNKMYNHPLSFNLYNLNNSKNNIRIIRKALIVEGEKGCLQYASFFGTENDISVACCGSNIIDYQIKLLINCGATEVIIGLDKQFQEVQDKEWEKLIKNYYNIYHKYGSYVQISYLFDKENLLDYKMSPLDAGPEVFLELYKKRIFL